MTYGIGIMYAIAGVALAIGIALLFRLRSPAISERQTYAYRMIGVMLLSLGLVLTISATAMWRWSVAP